MNRLLVLTAYVVASHAQAQITPDPPCRYAAKKSVAFASTKSRDQLTVSVGPGPCHSAKLAIVITSERGKVLYRYEAPFKRHTALPSDDPALPNAAREFVDHTMAHMIVEQAELPTAKLRSKMIDDDVYELTITEAKMKELLAAGQPVLHHNTYYEGGQFVAYDPTTRKAQVIIQWGL